MRTGADGRFRLDGLLPRTYVLDAWSPFDLWRELELCTVRSGPVQAGAIGLELRLEPDPWIERLAGRVVDLAGTPWSGLVVSLLLDRPMVSHELGNDGSVRWSETDAEGRFDLGRVPARRSYLRVGTPGSGTQGLPVPLSASGPEDGWTFRLPRGPNLRVDWERDAPLPEALEILDEEGARLPVFTFSAGRLHSCEEQVRLRGARGLLLAVAISARTLQLRSGGEVVLRSSLGVVPDEVQRVVLD